MRSKRITSEQIASDGAELLVGAPLGLQAALRYVDHLLPCASVASLQRLGELLGTLGRGGER